MSLIGSDRDRHPYSPLSARTARIAGNVLGRVATAASVLLGPFTIGVSSASAEPCPDVEVVFGRGTFEPPGIGVMGEPFVDALRAEPELSGKSIDVYDVNYPASLDFSTAADGVVDASNKVRDVAVRCPSTKMVLGGYSQGAAVIAYVTEDAIPAGFTLPPEITEPMPPDVAKHVAAVALFGKPSSGFLNTVDRDAPPTMVGHLYTAKTIEQCIPEDPICSPTGNDGGAHGAYAVNGLVAQAADFAAHKLGSSPRLSTPQQLTDHHA
jgi:cutinase